jgi:hypothetical protein
VSKNGLRAGAMALSTVVIVGLGSATAFAATPTTNSKSLTTIQAQAAAAITLRVDDLDAAIAKVNGTSHLGASGASLVTYLQADIAPLQALGTKIAGDTSVTTALSDSSTIFASYRVLALVLPAARVAATADAIAVTAIPDLTATAAKAASHVNSSNSATLQPLMDDLNSQIQSAATGTSNLATTLLGYTPTQWNANPNLLAPARGSVQAATADIAKARNDVRQMRTILHTAPATTSTPTPTPTTTTAG